MRYVLRGYLLVACLIFIVGSAVAQSKQRVKFSKGATSTTIKGTIRGFDYRDYLVEASAGQTINIKLNSPNTYTMFGIFRPDGENLDRAAQVADFAGKLPETGDYTIRVAMMRAEARRKGSVSDYSLTISIQ